MCGSAYLHHPPNERLKFLVAEAHRMREANWVDLDVVIGGEIVPVAFGEIKGGQWNDLCAHNPATQEPDRPNGYNRAAVARAFPAERIKLQDRPTDQDTWAEVWDLLDGEDSTNIQAVLWGLHIGDYIEARNRLRAKRDEVTPQGDETD